MICQAANRCGHDQELHDGVSEYPGIMTAAQLRPTYPISSLPPALEGGPGQPEIGRSVVMAEIRITPYYSLGMV